MVETTYKTWWILHLRMARDENLNTEEQAAYEAGLRQLHQEEILNVDVAILRKGRAKVAALEAENAQLQARRNTLEAEIAALETALGKRYDTVVLLEAVDGFQKGEKGATVEVYTTPYEAYDIEIVTDEGKTKGLVEAVRPEQSARERGETMTRCYFCQGPVKESRVRAIRERKGKIFVIEDVPSQVCQQCGEEFYRGWVLEEMDRLMDGGEGVEQEITVPVVRFTRELVA